MKERRKILEDNIHPIKNHVQLSEYHLITQPKELSFMIAKVRSIPFMHLNFHLATQNKTKQKNSPQNYIHENLIFTHRTKNIGTANGSRRTRTEKCKWNL